MIERRRLLGALLLILGILVFGTGVYFMGIRPPLLPEDLRVTGVVPDTLPPAFLGWLSIVFRTWGGFVIGTSLWLLGYSLEFLTARERWLKVGAASGLLFAFGSFLFSNVQLRSDFLWFIGVLAALAAWVACLLLWPAKARPR